MRAKTKNLFGGLIAVLTGVLGIGGFVLYAINKVRTGHGLDYYFTGHGVQMNYIGALITIGVIGVAMLVGSTIKLWSQRRRGWSVKRLRIEKRKKDKT